MSEGLLDALFSTLAMDALFCDRARIQTMLDFEAGLARAMRRCGMVPSEVADAIEAACVAEHYDIAALGRSTRLAGNPAIPLVEALRADVAGRNAAAARWVHHGATSQDVIDSGLILQLRSALVLLAAGQDRLLSSLERLVREHRATVMPGRTLLQQAVPVTFGYKAANWLLAVHESRVRLRRLTPEVLQLQFGGAAGTLSALGSDGPRIAVALAQELSLGLPPMPWHTRRDRVVELAAAVALLVGVLGKLARDVALLMQSEVAEAFEPAMPGKGGSSAMPHKRNPVGSVIAQAAAARVPGLVATMFSVMPQEHERGVGGWHAEWETLPEILRLAAGALAHVEDIVGGLEVHAERMRGNLESGLGLLYAEAVSVALAPSLGQAEARRRVRAASRSAVAEGRHLREVMRDEADLRRLLPEDRLAGLFDPDAALGAVDWMINRALAAVEHQEATSDGDR